MVSRYVKTTVGGTPRVVDLARQPVPEGFERVVIRGGGFVTGLVAHPGGQLYARTDVGGAHRRDPAADTWVQMVTSSGVPEPHPSDYEVEGLGCAPSDPDVVYASVGNSRDYALNGRVLRSTNGGATWTASGRDWYIGGNEEWRYAGARIAVDPSDPDVVYLGTRKDGLHYSTDGGQTWTKLTALPAAVGDPTTTNAVGVNAILIDPDSPVSGGRHQTMWVSVRGVGLCKTVNGGGTWTTISALTGGWVRDMMLADNGGIFGCFYAQSSAPNSSVRRIAPDNTVTTITPGVERRWATIAVDPTNPDRVVVGSDGINNDSRLFRTTNGTAGTPTWIDLNVAIANGAKGTVWPTSSDILDYMSTGQLRFANGVLWFAEGMGMWRTTDLADTTVTWEFASDGIEELVANDIYKPPGKALVTASWDRGLFRHPDPTNTNPGAGLASYLPYRTGFGSAWDITASPTDPLFLAAVLDDHQDLTGVTNPQRRASGYSTDGGGTWTRFGALAAGTAPADLLFGNIAVSAANSDNLVWIPSRLTGLASKIYYTTNRGGTWTSATLTGLTADDYLHPTYTLDRHILAAHPSVPGTFYALGGNNAGAAHVWRTTNAGATWAKVATTGLRPTSGDFRWNSHLVILDNPLTFIATGNVPICYSEDGVTWDVRTDLVAPVGMGVGAPMTEGGNPALYTYGTVGGTEGLYRSTNHGDTWDFLTAHPNDCHQNVRGVAGDPEVPGRVYVGFAGVSYTVGQFT